MTVQDRILNALRNGHNTKAKALREAWFGTGEGQHECACSWNILVREGRIEKRGRTWHVVESEVAP